MISLSSDFLISKIQGNKSKNNGEKTDGDDNVEEQQQLEMKEIPNHYVSGDRPKEYSIFIYNLWTW